MMDILYIFLALAGVAIIIWLAMLITRTVRRLDKRIEEYREEGPPMDPYGELAKLLTEDEKSRPDSKHRDKGGSKENS